VGCCSRRVRVCVSLSGMLFSVGVCVRDLLIFLPQVRKRRERQEEEASRALAEKVRRKDDKDLEEVKRNEAARKAAQTAPAAGKGKVRSPPKKTKKTPNPNCPKRSKPTPPRARGRCDHPPPPQKKRKKPKPNTPPPPHTHSPTRATSIAHMGFELLICCEGAARCQGCRRRQARLRRGHRRRRVCGARGQAGAGAAARRLDRAQDARGALLLLPRLHQKVDLGAARRAGGGSGRLYAVPDPGVAPPPVSDPSLPPPSGI